MAMLPHIGEAVIPEKKIVDYLLSLTHESGRDKAVFFSHFGFVPEAWERLAHALRQHAAQHQVARIEASLFGERYVIEGEIDTPSGRKPKVRAVWFLKTNERIPHFVTAYPLKGV